MTNFETIEQASERWITEGKAYKNALNDWLDMIYIDQKQPETECPEETRKDMGNYVKDKIIEFNKQGKYKELRALFPPDSDPMNWENLTPEAVIQIAVLPDYRVVATVEKRDRSKVVYIIQDNTTTVEEGIFMFGRSFDKKYFAKVSEQKIDVVEGWDGPVVASFKSPDTYGEEFQSKHPSIKEGLSQRNFNSMKLQQVVVFASGKRVAIASEVGIFILNESGSQFIQTEQRKTEDAANEYDEEDEDGFTFGYDYPHVAVSPDDMYLAVGSQSSNHMVLKEENGTWNTIASVEPRSSYPNLAAFNYGIKDNGEQNDGPQLVLASCHFGGSATVSLPIKHIVPGFFASGYNADDTLNYVDLKKWVFSIGLYSWGYGLGCNDGYIWFKYFNGYQYGYLHVGGTVMSIDFSDDRKIMAVASYDGQVILYDVELFPNGSIFRMEANREDKRKDDYAITNTSLVDQKRFLFWHGHEPMVW